MMSEIYPSRYYLNNLKKYLAKHKMHLHRNNITKADQSSSKMKLNCTLNTLKQFLFSLPLTL